MSVIINIKGTQITFPTSGESPDWAPAVVEFAQAVENAILSAVGVYDVPPQAVELTSDNTTLDITNLNFPTSAVRSAYIKYSLIFFDSLSNCISSETGNIIVYNDETQWLLTRDYVNSVAETGCDFTITNTPTAQLQVIIPVIPGFSSGKISFSAQTLPKD